MSSLAPTDQVIAPTSSSSTPNAFWQIVNRSRANHASKKPANPCLAFKMQTFFQPIFKSLITGACVKPTYLEMTAIQLPISAVLRRLFHFHTFILNGRAQPTFIFKLLATDVIKRFCFIFISFFLWLSFFVFFSFFFELAFRMKLQLNL